MSRALAFVAGTVVGFTLTTAVFPTLSQMAGGPWYWELTCESGLSLSPCWHKHLDSRTMRAAGGIVETYGFKTQCESRAKDLAVELYARDGDRFSYVCKQIDYEPKATK